MHSNGFSLVRELIKRKKINLKNKIGNKTIGEIILKPTKIYVKEILELKKKINIKAIAHITGGGLTGNLERIIPKNMKITLFKNTLFNFHKKLFLMLKKASNLSDIEMLETFNCGNGMVLVVNKNDLKKAEKYLVKLRLSYKVIGQFSSLKKGDGKITIE